MSVAVITGAYGLVGSESCEFFHTKGLEVIGIDNNYRKYFFGSKASNEKNADILRRRLKKFRDYNLDIRSLEGIKKIFKKYGKNISVIIHAASQPSHEWSAREPITDFKINANGTLNLLEATRKYSPQANFVFISTNKVYGDTPNRLPLIEQESRWEIKKSNKYYKFGIDEIMSLDKTIHTPFGVSKLAADMMTQEYGRYFGLNTAVFRCGCITGQRHAGVKAHGFLSYLTQCAIFNKKYTIIGYKGKQVRDNIHSSDLARAFGEFILHPQPGAVYNLGGSRENSCSIIEAIDILKNILKREIQTQYIDTPRIGDHIWWISDNRSFKKKYPQWELNYNLEMIIEEMIDVFSSKYTKVII